MLEKYEYRWPAADISSDPRWKASPDGSSHVRGLPEDPEALRADSRWPAFFPSPMGLATTGSGPGIVLERVVGPVIVNRFPYVMALSLCRERLSDRHYPRRRFMETLESTRCAAVQFLPPGQALDAALTAGSPAGEEGASGRLRAAALATTRAVSHEGTILKDSYMVYEGRLARPCVDPEGRRIYEQPWVDVGSHRIYFLEVSAVQLRADIAAGRSRIAWRSLPAWRPLRNAGFDPEATKGQIEAVYKKTFTPHYQFPAAGTIAFESDGASGEMAVKRLSLMKQDQVRLDNDAARWPCFFPSSLVMVTSRGEDGASNMMPCGSSALLSRRPLTIALGICYARINERYAPRATLAAIRKTGRFGCAVPFIDERVTRAISYSGSVSVADDPKKILHSGMTTRAGRVPIINELPLHFECALIQEVRLGTHVLVLGRVEEITVRSDVSAANPLAWSPWADVPQHGLVPP